MYFFYLWGEMKVVFEFTREHVHTLLLWFMKPERTNLWGGCIMGDSYCKSKAYESLVSSSGRANLLIKANWFWYCLLFVNGVNLCE